MCSSDLYLVTMSGMNDIGLYRQIVVNKLCRHALIGDDAADFCRCEKYILWLMFGEKTLHGALVGEVQFRVRAHEKVRVSLRLKRAHDGGAHHAAMTSNINSGVDFQRVIRFLPGPLDMQGDGDNDFNILIFLANQPSLGSCL